MLKVYEHMPAKKLKAIIEVVEAVIEREDSDRIRILKQVQDDAGGAV